MHAVSGDCFLTRHVFKWVETTVFSRRASKKSLLGLFSGRALEPLGVEIETAFDRRALLLLL